MTPKQQPKAIKGGLWANVDGKGFPVVYASRDEAELDREDDETTVPVSVIVRRAKPKELKK